MTRMCCHAATIAVVFGLFTAITVVAQLFPGRVTGQVRDTQGAVIAGASVKLTNPATGFERSIITNQNGEFNFPELGLGSFDLSVSKARFQTIILIDIRTSDALVNTLAPVLKVVTVSTEVEV